MDLATILNPSSTVATNTTLTSFTNPLSSPPLSPKQIKKRSFYKELNYIKPRSRFSVLEDTIICEGVANGLTWGQISGQLPHRKRATCFNRYRTLQGIRKSRKGGYPSLYHETPSSSYLSSRRASLPTHLLSSTTSSTCTPLFHSERRPSFSSSSSSSHWLPSPPSNLLSINNSIIEHHPFSPSSSFDYNRRRVSTCSLPPPSSLYNSRRSSIDSTFSNHPSSFYPY
ncbi:unnamed protein product [Cunninghamella blakesleeana]